MEHSKSDTKQRLVEKAAALLWERSYHATSVDDLCTLAQAKKGSFYHFFPSKIDLAVAAIHQSWEVTRETIFDPVFQTDVSGLSQLQLLVARIEEVQETILRRGGHFLGCPFGGLGQEMAHQDERIRQTVQDVFDAHCGYIEGALRRAVAADEIDDCDVRLRARVIFALLEGAALLAKVANQSHVYQEIAPSILVLARHG
jgi:TetR/AcrR family transcriptional repressor of nem operon